MSPKKNFFTKIELSPKQKCHQNWNITKTEMSPKLKFPHNWNVTKTEMVLKLKSYQNWNVTTSKKFLKNKIQRKIKIQEIDPDYLGLVWDNGWKLLKTLKRLKTVENSWKVLKTVEQPIQA